MVTAKTQSSKIVGPGSMAVMFRKRMAILALVVLFIAASALCAYSIKASSEKSGKNSFNAKPSAQVAILGQTPTVRFKEDGKPWINLAEGREVEAAYAGNQAAIAQLVNDAKPLSLTSADFDSDGVPDVVAGYAAPNGGGIVVFMRGNVDSIYPNSPEAKLHRQQGVDTSAPFLSPAMVFAAPAAPEFLSAGDFDGDGKVDLVLTNRDSNQLFLMKGTGGGSFGSDVRLSLPGKVTALAAGDVNRADGLMDIVVATATNGSAQMLVFENPNGAFNGPPEVFPLPAESPSIAIGQLDPTDGFVDIAVAAGRNLVVTHGRDRNLTLDLQTRARVAAPRIEQRQFTMGLKAVAIGYFTDGQETDLAVLGDDGSVQTLTGKRQDGTPLRGVANWSSKALSSTALTQPTKLIGARLSSLPVESLIVVDSASNQVQVLTDGNSNLKGAPQGVAVPEVASALMEVTSGTAAVLPMRLNQDALSDLVVLRSNQAAISVVVSVMSMTFTVTNTNDTGAGSLAQAIIDANTNPGADLINFAIGSGPQTINLLTDLPPLLDPVTVDATTQPGFAGSPIIEVSGLNTASGRVFKVAGGSSVIRGFVLNRCSLSTITLQSVGNDKVEGCFLGTNAAGTAALPNSLTTGDGVEVFSISGCVIGGTVAAAHNLISGNTDDGVDISGVVATGNLVQGNFIGTDVTGTLAVPNHHNGVYLNSKLNTVGGATAAASNVISGSLVNGVRILSDITITGNIIQGNLIGTNAAGTAALGNAGGVGIFNSPANTIGGTVLGSGNVISGNIGNGVLIMDDDATGNLIQGNTIGSSGLGNTGNGVVINLAPFNTTGGVVPNSQNTISFNGGKGFVITGTSDDAIRQNSIFSNTGIGIDLGDDGVTTNDVGDGDIGANGLLNFPVITFASGGASTLVQGTYNGLPNQTMTLEFFLNSAPDPSGFGEGEIYIGTTTVNTDGSGNATFNVTFAVVSSAGQFVTSTATKATGSTSEFSLAVVVCVYSIAPTSKAFTETGGTGTVDVTTQGGCPWTAVSNDAFITVTGGTPGAGNGTVNYSVAPKPNSGLRTGTITIAEKTFTVNQQGPCISISIPAILHAPAGSTLTVPISVANSVTGLGITSYNFVLAFNPAVVSMAAPAFDTAGTMSSGYTVTPNTGVSGQVTISASGGAPLSGSGLLLNLRVILTGAPGTCSNLTWTSFTFDSGTTPCASTSNGQACTIAIGSDTAGLFDPVASAFFLKNSNSTGIADLSFAFGPAGGGLIPLAGDWDGDGVDTIGLYNPITSTFFLRNSNTTGIADVAFPFGAPGAGMIPLAGDWNGDGIDTVGLYNPAAGTFFLRNSNTGGVADITFAFGPGGAGLVPITGDWDNDGIDTVGLYNPAAGTFFLRNSNTSGVADISFAFGPAGAGLIPLARDWNGDGVDTIGLYNPAAGAFFLKNANTTGVADISFSFGPGGLGLKPLVGDWDGL